MPDDDPQLPSAAAMSERVKVMVAWYLENREHAPKTEFKLRPGITVTDPAKFLGYLDKAVASLGDDDDSYWMRTCLVSQLELLQKVVEMRKKLKGIA